MTSWSMLLYVMQVAGRRSDGCGRFNRWSYVLEVWISDNKTHGKGKKNNTIKSVLK